jgi:hypothetical protein
MVTEADLGGKRWRYLSGVKEYKQYNECPVVEDGVKGGDGAFISLGRNAEVVISSLPPGAGNDPPHTRHFDRNHGMTGSPWLPCNSGAG